MSAIPSITYVLDGLGIFGVIVGGYIASNSAYSKQNSVASTELIANLQKLRQADKDEFNSRIDALEERHREDEKLHNENARAIADLQGQIKTYKELPLIDLANGIKKIATSNDSILKQLKDSALIEATK